MYILPLYFAQVLSVSSFVSLCGYRSPGGDTHLAREQGDAVQAGVQGREAHRDQLVHLQRSPRHRAEHGLPLGRVRDKGPLGKLRLSRDREQTAPSARQSPPPAQPQTDANNSSYWASICSNQAVTHLILLIKVLSKDSNGWLVESGV